MTATDPANRGRVAHEGAEVKPGPLAAASNSRWSGFKLANEVVIVHDFEDECPHPFGERVEPVWVPCWPKTGRVHVASGDELAKPIRAVAAAEESGSGSVGVQFHRDRVVRLASPASLPDFVERTLM